MNTRVMNCLLTLGIVATLAGCAAGVAPIQPITEAGGGQRLPLRNEVVSSVALAADGAAEDGLYAWPTDAAPNADGTAIYFTALGAQQPGVYRVDAAGGAVSPLTQGGPLVMPLGLAVSGDDATVYIADSQADAGGMMGQVFAVASEGGEAQPIAGTEGTMPRALATARENGVEVVYLSGVDASDGQPAVMKLTPGDADSLTVVAKGDPLVEPGGLAVANDGALYVADRLASGDELGSIFRVEDSNLTPIAEGVRLGNPVGLALTTDDALLLASALNPATGRAQVLLIDLASGEQGIINRVIEANMGSGGVHRAADVNVFAWADLPDGPRGKGGVGGVYEIRP